MQANPDLPADSPAVINAALQDIQSYLADHGRSLADFPPMPVPVDDVPVHQQPQLLREELCYDRAQLQTEVQEGLPRLNEAQRHVFDEVTAAMDAPANQVWLTGSRQMCNMKSWLRMRVGCTRAHGLHLLTSPVCLSELCVHMRICQLRRGG